MSTFFTKMSVIVKHQKSSGQDNNMQSQADSEMDEATKEEIEQDMEELHLELYYDENKDKCTNVVNTRIDTEEKRNRLLGII